LVGALPRELANIRGAHDHLTSGQAHALTLSREAELSFTCLRLLEIDRSLVGARSDALSRLRDVDEVIDARHVVHGRSQVE
jgi:hypothetical protein